MKKRLTTYLAPFLVGLMFLIVGYIDKEAFKSIDFLRAIYIVSTTIPLLYLLSINREEGYVYQSQLRFMSFPLAPRALLKKEVVQSVGDPHFLVPVLISLAAITWSCLTIQMSMLYVFGISMLFCGVIFLLLIAGNLIKYRYADRFRNYLLGALFCIVLQLDITYLVDEYTLHIIYALLPNSAFLMIVNEAPVIQAVALCSIVVSLYGTYFLWKKDLHYINT